MPRLSIITINLNNSSGLIDTIESVIGQNFIDFEYIIIDGASKDGSLDVINKYADKIKYWVSEPDLGIYNAMNKGIRASSGEFLLFLNSGDFLFNPFVLTSWNELIKPETEICSGNIITISGQNKVLIKSAKEVSLYYCVFDGLGHPNTFIKRSLFTKYGYYNEANKIISDWEFFLLTLGLNSATYQYIDVTISCFMRNGLSTDPGNARLIEKEKELAIKKHVPKSILFDLFKLHDYEMKMNQTNFKTLTFLDRFPVLSFIIFSPLRVLSSILRKIGLR